MLRLDLYHQENNKDVINGMNNKARGHKVPYVLSIGVELQV
jgi:hypothetical protein